MNDIREDAPTPVLEPDEFEDEEWGAEVGVFAGADPFEQCRSTCA